MFEVNKKTFLIITAVVLGILILGTTPSSKNIQRPEFEKPSSGKWCLGYDYKNGKYRYDTSSKQPTKRIIRKSLHSKEYTFQLYENGNFTKEQAKDIQDYLEFYKSIEDSYDYEDIIDNLDYYLD